MMSALAGYLLLQTLVYTTEPATPAPPPVTQRSSHPQGLAYFADRDAQADVDRALADAKLTGRIVVVIMGANWCHDSVGLAGWLDTPRFMDMMQDRYRLVYVDVGTPQTGKGRNLDIAKRFGIGKVRNTPLVMLLSADGKLLNSRKDAIGWRNAASRSEDDIYRYFATFTPS
ncbi:MAG: thioredoxin family protein [Sphingomonadaceae bacterium]|nr:thioredoxin family protein [Sphingomonadaceae bacterium]